MGPVMRWVVVLVLLAVSLTAWAQPTQMDKTTAAWNAAVAAERNLAQLAQKRSTLAARFQTELRAVDRLKNSPRSWRRDKELRDKLSEANEIGRQLESATADLGKAQKLVDNARKTLVAAIDAELATSPATARKTQLAKARAQVLPQSRRAHRIVLPSTQIDPLADPAELIEQARLLRQSEAELQKQIQGLEIQAKELERVAQLRKHNERTREMDRRDDNSSRKGPGNGTGRTAEATADNSPEGPAPPPTEPTSNPMFEMDSTIVLVEIVDQPTIDSLRNAQRSGDPKQRAEALRRAREGVIKKADQMRAAAKQAEDRAKQMRGGR
jgi:hypothetical protein